MRRAYRERADYLGDTDFVAVPVGQLTSPLYAAGLRASINPARATPSALLPGQVNDARGAANGNGLVGDEANAIAPGKRPLSSMSPTFLEGQRGLAILGTPGGSRIITMVLLGGLEIMQGGDAAAAVSRARFHHQFLPDVVQYEPGAFSPELAAALGALGHTLKPFDRPYGNMQAIWWDKTHGRVQAASDPRGGGAAELR